MDIGESISGAVFSDSNRRFRYALWRIWQPTGDKLLYTGLNPSTANDIKDDPTIVRLVGFAKIWGFGGLFASNLVPFVSANPEEMCRWLESSTEQWAISQNDLAIKQMRGLCTKSFVGWGNEGGNTGLRPKEVLALLGEPVYCIKTTIAGEPCHPLYMPLSSQLIPYVRNSQDTGGIK